MTDDLLAYTVAHWRVTEDGLAWQPCGPDCPHERQADVTRVTLTSVDVPAESIIWVGTTTAKEV
jgi:hypothetical protein